jgi:hypothetical protein
MERNRTIRPSDIPDGDLVMFGPTDVKTGKHLRIPRTFSRIVDIQDLQFQLQLWCRFSGDRIEVRRLCIEADGGEIASRQLLQLGLPAIVREIAFEVIPEASFWTVEGQDAVTKWSEMNSQPEFIAQVYWFEHVSWGSPRQEIMRLFGIKRTAANTLLRKLAREISLPGIRKENETKGSSSQP